MIWFAKFVNQTTTIAPQRNMQESKREPRKIHSKI
jgi:hypothetical protein